MVWSSGMSGDDRTMVNKSFIDQLAALVDLVMIPARDSSLFARLCALFLQKENN
jgi:hypothetical protein